MTGVELTRPMRKSDTVDLKCDVGHVWMNKGIFIVKTVVS
jgi:hypothetical protein